jgi:hypothetical protein
VGRLYRLPYHPHQIIAECVQVCLVAQSGREDFQGLSRVVLAAVEAPVRKAQISNRRGAGERRVAEGESPGLDSIGQVSQSIESYPTVGGQLTPCHRDHVGWPDGQKVIPSGMERRLLLGKTRSPANAEMTRSRRSISGRRKCLATCKR